MQKKKNGYIKHGDANSKKNQKGLTEIRSTITEKKYVFDGLMSNLDVAEERTGEDLSVETSITAKHILLPF